MPSLHKETGRFSLRSSPIDEEKVLCLLPRLTPSLAAPWAGGCPYLGPGRSDGHIFSGDAKEHDACQSRYDHQPGGKEFTPRHEALSPFAKSQKRKQRSSKLTAAAFYNLLKEEKGGAGARL